MKPLPLLAAAFILSPLAPAVLAQADPDAANWPGFRGPGGRGVVADNPRLPEQWDSETNVEWKVEVPGTGWSSPVVWGDKVLLTSAVNEADSEPPKPGLYFGGNRPTPKTVHRWIVHCVDLESGNTLWEHTVHRGAPPHGRHLKNSFASETPVTDGVRFYCYFGNVGLFAFDMDGKRLWERKWKAVKTRYNWGTAASPVLHNGRLYLINDNDDGSFLECLNAKDGETVWRTARPNEKSNWSTPCVWEHEGRTEIVTTGSGKARSYDLDGKQLWSLGGMSSMALCCAQWRMICAVTRRCFGSWLDAPSSSEAAVRQVCQVAEEEEALRAEGCRRRARRHHLQLRRRREDPARCRRS